MALDDITRYTGAVLALHLLPDPARPFRIAGVLKESCQLRDDAGDPVTGARQHATCA